MELGYFFWFKVLTVVAGLGLAIAAAVVLLVKEGLTEVGPMRAQVYKNTWTGRARALLPGTSFIIPGIEKRLTEITFADEPSSQNPTKVITADGVEVTIDYVIFHQKVGGKVEEGTKKLVDTDNVSNEDDLSESAVKVATKIDYNQRTSLVVNRVKAYIQNEFSQARTEHIYGTRATEEAPTTPATPATPTTPVPTVSKEFIEEKETAINALLQREREEWGLLVVIEIENIRLPEKLAEVAEEVATATKEGKKIKDKAEAAGVPTEWVLVGDIVTDALRALTGTGKGGKK